MSQFLFISDLDNTLIGDDIALEQLNKILQKKREADGTKIVYATGRSLFLYKKLTTEKPLIPPDALIAAVGTEIYLNPESQQIDQDWVKLLSNNWQRDKILEITQTFPELVLQPESEQGQFKISFHLSADTAKQNIEQLENRLKENGLEIKLIYSGSKDLDLIPQQADKGLAVNFLQNKWDFNDLKTVVCGDSGNDIALFSTGQPHGILVGNAQIELREWYQNNQTNYRYFADQNYAAGIQEGLQYFHFI
ncbi:sucrose phosphatase [Halothece sp. PCC 7418]|uniref:sucrose-phosphate phosphatase n=1 Tax=Halothece sp. (strain PCC 7418) TaxID=65093 RepID=UPI0002A06CDF|nr:sucrose-phosphate phosphatase [Halothece sp. PCC 7418]AFZ43562.1 sucrose phosphatase [Halothece sp. PCC 7418]